MATTNTYQKQGIYKLGRTRNLRDRFASDQTGRPSTDQMWYYWTKTNEDIRMNKT